MRHTRRFTAEQAEVVRKRQHSANSYWSTGTSPCDPSVTSARPDGHGCPPIGLRRNRGSLPISASSNNARGACEHKVLATKHYQALRVKARLLSFGFSLLLQQQNMRA